MADDCRKHKTSLNSLSAFPFENALGVIKCLVRNSNNPVAQVVKRFSESRVVTHAKLSKIILKPESRDDAVLLKNGELGIETNVLDDVLMIKIITRRLLRDLYHEPFSIGQIRLSQLVDFHVSRKQMCHISVKWSKFL